MRPLLRTIGVAAAVLCLSAGEVAAQENELTILLPGDPPRTAVVGLFRRAGVAYVSLTDLTEVFGFTSYLNAAAGKLEIRSTPFRVRVTGGSPFIALTDPAHPDVQAVAYQLAHPVLFAADAFFVPLLDFLPYAPKILGRVATLDPHGARLTLDFPRQQPAFDIPGVILEPKSNGMVIRIPATRRLTDFESALQHNGWLYLTVPDARADTTAIKATPLAGIVKGILAFQSPSSIQLTFRLSGAIASSEVIQDSASNDLLLAIRTETPAAAAPRQPRPSRDTTKETPVHPPAVAPNGTIPAEGKARPAPPDLGEQRKRWELDVIVIDAGHGGHDPGTIGVTGVKEKTVTLGIALKLGRLISRQLKDVKVVYTRDSDRFVELDKRGTIANEAGGKLFISIHANAMPRHPHPARGFEVYLLRPGRTEEAVAIAERENAVITLEEGYAERYQELNEENFILVTMAQSAYVRASEVFADLSQQELEKVTRLPNRGVKQAGFYVLVGAAMPNVLVETAYLSNAKDEQFLKSEAGQQKVADALLRAVKKYKTAYERLLREGETSAR
jgi:N-acetylmuramoyl-L-alanine amidase